MGDTWIPDDIFDMKPLIRNFFENTSTVQVISLSWIILRCLALLLQWSYYMLISPCEKLNVFNIILWSYDSYQVIRFVKYYNASMIALYANITLWESEFFKNPIKNPDLLSLTVEHVCIYMYALVKKHFSFIYSFPIILTISTGIVSMAIPLWNTKLTRWICVDIHAIWILVY